MRAAVISEARGVVVKDVPKPTLKQGEVLIAVRAAAVNPIDFKLVDTMGPVGAILGNDCVGEVVEVNGNEGSFRVGDRVAAVLMGGRSAENGAFAEYAKSDAKLVWPIPNDLSNEEAAAMAFGGPFTAMQHLYTIHEGIPWPTDSEKANGEPFLVWGGSTSVGMYAIQLAKLSGCTVVATSSPKNFDLLKSLGADDVYAYSDAETPSRIASKYPNLSKAIDCVTTDGSTKLTSRSLGSQGGGLVSTLGMPKPDDNAGRDNVKVQLGMGFTLLGKPFPLPNGHNIPASERDYEAAQRWAKSVPQLVAEGKFKPNPIWHQKGGLDRIAEGIDLLRQGKVSAQKVVYTIA